MAGFGSPFCACGPKGPLHPSASSSKARNKRTGRQPRGRWAEERRANLRPGAAAGGQRGRHLGAPSAAQPARRLANRAHTGRRHGGPGEEQRFSGQEGGSRGAVTPRRRRGRETARPRSSRGARNRTRRSRLRARTLPRPGGAERSCGRAACGPAGSQGHPRRRGGRAPGIGAGKPAADVESSRHFSARPYRQLGSRAQWAAARAADAGDSPPFSGRICGLGRPQRTCATQRSTGRGRGSWKCGGRPGTQEGLTVPPRRRTDEPQGARPLPAQTGGRRLNSGPPERSGEPPGNKSSGDPNCADT